MMKIVLLPVLQQMKRIYEMPRDRNRFNAYLSLLQGNSKSDMILPIAGYNPMAKEIATHQLDKLISIDTEQIMQSTINTIVSKLPDSPDQTLRVAINLVDDVEGAWSERYVTDYKNRFEINGLINRNFCTPIVYTSEIIDEALIVIRTKEAIYRSIYWIKFGTPQTLEDCVIQKQFVSDQTNENESSQIITSENKAYYNTHKNSTDYNRIFHFFYGNEAARSLGYPTYDE